MSYKILIVTRYFYPDNTPRAFRATELANELATTGNDVVILTCRNSPFHQELENRYGYKIKDIGQLRFKQINLNIKNKYLLYLKTAWRRILLMLFEYPDIELMWKLKKTLDVESGYDLLISNAVPHPIHWGVAWARTSNQNIAKTWVADCGDPYMGCKTDSFKKLFYFSFLEKWFCRKCDFITLPNQDHMPQYYRQFQSKIRIIPQGFKFENADLYKGVVSNEVVTFAFAGVLLKQARNPQKILDYLAGVPDKFRFVIYTQSVEMIEKYKPLLKDKLEIRPFIRREKLLYELSKMDFVLNIEFHSSVQSNSPSKLIDYAIVNRPILSLDMDAPDTSKIDKFLKRNYDDRLIISDVDKYRIENVAKEFLMLLS